MSKISFIFMMLLLVAASHANDDIICKQQIAGEKDEVSSGVSAVDGQKFVCDPSTMLKLADLYLSSQVVRKWDDFLPHIADDITMGVLSVDGHVTEGKEAATQLMLALGYVSQSIDAIVEGPKNWLRSDGVLALFTKTQRSLATGVHHNLSFAHMISFNSDCKVTDITEMADLLKTEDNFPLAFGNKVALMCKLLEKVCHSVTYDWGESKTCYNYWKNAPEFSKNPETLKLHMYAKTLACLGTVIDSVESNPTVAPYICPRAGRPVEGQIGCW